MKRTSKIVLIILLVLTVFISGCTLSGRNKSIKVKFFVKKDSENLLLEVELFFPRITAFLREISKERS